MLDIGKRVDEEEWNYPVPVRRIFACTFTCILLNKLQVSN